VLHLEPSNRLSFASLPCDLHDDATCTTRRCSFTSCEAKLENPNATCFTTMQVVGCRRVSSHRLHPFIDFEVQSNKPPSIWFWSSNQQNIDTDFEAQTGKPTLLVFFLCMMWITHGVTRPPDRLATEYLTYARSSPILRTKSPTPASIIIIARHIAFATYTSWDKQMHFSTPNSWTWISSIEMRLIQIQTRISQLLITQISQDTNHMVSQKASIDKPRWTLLGSLANSGSKWSRANQALASAGCDIISTSSLSCISSLGHLICCIVSSHRNNCFSFGVIGM
jgi:hypothetical protein